MKHIIQRILSLFRRNSAHTPLTKPTPCLRKHICHNDIFPLPFSVKVFGKKISLQSSKYCVSCTEQKLNEWSTVCEACEEPILPDTPVGLGCTEGTFTHLTFDCSIGGIAYCGKWGNGRLITLHELDPRKYPENTQSLGHFAIQSKNMVIENL